MFLDIICYIYQIQYIFEFGFSQTEKYKHLCILLFLLVNLINLINHYFDTKLDHILHIQHACQQKTCHAKHFWPRQILKFKKQKLKH